MPKNCDTCKYDLFRLCGEEDKTPCDDCYNGNPPTKWEPGENYEPKTNADRIRAMSDEELCDLFREIYNAGCDDSTAYSWGRNTYSFVWDKEWLHAPAEGE